MSWTLFTVWDIRVRLHSFAVLWVGLSFYYFSSPGVALAVNGLLFLSVFLHELGHCLAARWVRGQAHEILLHPFGGLSRLRVPRTPWAEFASTAAGPLANLLLLGVCLPLAMLAGAFSSPSDVFAVLRQPPSLAWALTVMVVVNGALVVFNVLPAYPMDGGRLLRAALWPVLGWRSATVVAICAAFVCGLVAISFGLPRGNLLLAALGVWVIYSSGRELKQALQTRDPSRDTDALPFEAPGAPTLYHDDDLMPHERQRP
ncbi:MAG: M50 family metallopeptidase [Planctomycetes bacterium]|nr:M50 family metallopeptidase [Planctomycetota bacterium]